MKAHSNELKKEIKTLGRQQTVRITYTLNNETKIINSEDINSATPNYEGNLLKSVMKELDLDSNIDIPKDTEIKFEYGLLTNGEYEYLNYGNYIVYSSEKQEDTLSYKIKCYDKLLYSMKDYEELDIAFPKTIKEYLIALCKKIGLEFKDSTFANQDREITNDLFKGLNYTYRDVLDQIAETTGGCICLTLDDKVEVRYINKLLEYSTSKNTNEVEIETQVKEKVKTINIDGNSYQETTEGYNLCLSFDSGTWTLKNGATISNNILTLPNANSSATSDFIEWNYGSLFNIQFFLNSGDNYHLDLSYYTENKESLGGNGRANKSATPNSTIKAFKNFSPTDSVKFKYIRFTFQRSTSYAPNEYSVSNVQISEKDADYEPYTGGIPSPNPDYPQEIEVIDSANRFDINKYQGIDCVLNGSATVTDTEITIKASSNNVTYTAIGLGNTGSVIAEAYRQYCMEIPEGANKLIVNFKNNNTVRLASIYYNVLDENYKVLSGIPRIYNSTDEEGILQADINVNNAKYVLVRFDAAAGGDVTYKNIALGNINKYLPYGNIGLEQSGINKLGLTNGTLKDGSGITVKELENGGISITGTASSDTNFVYIWKLKNIVKNNQLITLSNGTTGVTGFQVSLRDSSKNIISETWTNNGAVKSATLTTDAYYYQIQINRNITVNTTIYPMIVEGAYSETTLPAYEPYHEPKIIPIDLQGNTLAKVGNVKDILKVNRNGEVKIEKKVGKIVLDGNETWKLYKTYLYTMIDDCALSPTISTKVATLLSDKFTATSLNDISNNANYGITYNALGDREQQKGVCFNVNDYFNSVATLKTWLPNNNVEVYYPLATPQTITLPSISPIELEQGTNIFSLVTNLDTEIELEYPTNYDTIDEEYINDTNVNFGEKYRTY